MKINKEELLEAMDVALFAVSKNSAIEEMLNFNFTNGQIVTYNGPLLLSVPFDLEGIEFSVPAGKFNKAIMAMPDEFTLEKKNECIELNGKKGKTKTNFGIASYNEHNDIVDIAVKNKRKLKDVEWLCLPEDFISGIKLCMFSVAKNSNLGTLSCLQIKNDRITSSDNNRISSFKMHNTKDNSMFTPLPEFLLPVENCRALIDLFPVFYYVTEDDNLIYFKTEDDIIITIRTVDGKYPDYASIAFMEYENYEDLLLPKEVLAMANNVGIINSDLTDAEQLVTLKMEKNTLTVNTTNVSGWGRQTIELDEEIEGVFETTMRLPSFIEIIKHTSEIRIVQDMKRIVFMSNQFRHVLPTIQNK